MKIAVDVMGGDYAPEGMVKGAAETRDILVKGPIESVSVAGEFLRAGEMFLP